MSTREKRNVVVEIWGQVAQKVPNLNLGPGRERREDLNHPDWADPLPPPAVDITDAGPEGREDQIEREGEASPSVPSGSAPSARSWSVVEHEPGDTPVKAKDLFPATPDLPLWVVAAVKRTPPAEWRARPWDVAGDQRPLRSRRPMASANAASSGMGSRRTGHWSRQRSPRCRRTRTPRRTQAPKRMTRWTPSRRPRWWP